MMVSYSLGYGCLLAELCVISLSLNLQSVYVVTLSEDL